MAIVFKDKKIERLPIEKDGTTFWFEVTEGLKRQVALNQMFLSDADFGGFLNEIFRKALVAWDNLQLADGSLVKYTPEVRDKITNNVEIFEVNDVLKVFGLDMAADKPEVDTKKKISTSKKR